MRYNGKMNNSDRYRQTFQAALEPKAPKEVMVITRDPTREGTRHYATVMRPSTPAHCPTRKVVTSDTGKRVRRVSFK